MAISYGNYVTPQIPNTTQREILRDGVLYMYEITPVDGYVFHDNRSDSTTPEGLPMFCYAGGSSSIGANYDFTPKTIEVEVLGVNGIITTEFITAYGVFDCFALERSKVPDPVSQIYGNNNHETI